MKAFLMKWLRWAFAQLVRLVAGKIRQKAIEVIQYKDCVHVRAPWGQQGRVEAVVRAPVPKKMRTQHKRAEQDRKSIKAMLEQAKRGEK